MNPTTFVKAVRMLKARHGASRAALVTLVPLLRDFVSDPANQQVPWPAQTRGAYTRMLLNDPADDFQIVVVAWPAGKCSPIHDHAGTVGAVAALAGATVERKFRVTARQGDSVWLRDEGATRLAGRAVALLAPEDGLELHDMAHDGAANSGATAATVHVYLSPVAFFNVYEPQPAGDHRCERRPLWMDVVHGARLWPQTAQPMLPARQAQPAQQTQREPALA